MPTQNNTQDVPLGYCRCGCGNKTNIAHYTDKRRGWIAGQPQPYVSGHSQSRPRINDLRTMFERYVLPGNEEACWIWHGPNDASQGYGRFTINHVVYVAHRVSYELFKGPIGADQVVCHACDNPPCVNPNHLFLGTLLENVEDMLQKQRNVRGAAHPTAKLDDSQVIQIRKLYASGQHTHLDLARQFGVSKSSIGGIVRLTKWRHVKA